MTGPKFPGTVWGQVNGIVRPVVLSRAQSEQAPPAGGSVYYSCKVQQKPEGGAESAGWCQVRLSAASLHLKSQRGTDQVLVLVQVFTGGLWLRRTPQCPAGPGPPPAARPPGSECAWWFHLAR